MQDHTPKALKSAKRLRTEMSLPEVLLWQRLRGRPMGVKFRSQHPIGAFVADFYCASRRLIVEVDGIAHNMGNRPERDARRDAWLRKSGMEVIRIAASDVLGDPDEVSSSIVALCMDAPPPSGASRLPPPPEGEDL